MGKYDVEKMWRRLQPLNVGRWARDGISGKGYAGGSFFVYNLPMDTKPVENGGGVKCISRCEFLRALERELALDDGSLNENRPLATLDMWDSLAAVQFMALADEHTGITVSGPQIANSKTVNDLLSLLGDRITT